MIVYAKDVQWNFTEEELKEIAEMTKEELAEIACEDSLKKAAIALERWNAAKSPDTKQTPLQTTST